MNELEQIRDELVRVANVAKEFSVNQQEIAAANNISYDYLLQIRKSGKPSRNTVENRSLLQSIINSYRKEIRRKRETLNSINVDIDN